MVDEKTPDPPPAGEGDRADGLRRCNCIMCGRELPAEVLPLHQQADHVLLKMLRLTIPDLPEDARLCIGCLQEARRRSAG